MPYELPSVHQWSPVHAQCSEMFSNVHQCMPNVQQCSPVFTSACPMFTSVHQYMPNVHHVHQCMPNVQQCSPVFTSACPMFTMFISACPMFINVQQCSAVFTSACKILRRLGEQITLTDWMGAMAGLVALDRPVAATVNTHQCLVSRLPGSALAKQAVRFWPWKRCSSRVWSGSLVTGVRLFNDAI